MDRLGPWLWRRHREHLVTGAALAVIGMLVAGRSAQITVHAVRVPCR